MSHPTWVRGLKLIGLGYNPSVDESHPTWVRGLKHNYGYICVKSVLSHPTWVRGLKLKLVTLLCSNFGRRTLRGCVD